MPVIGTSEIQLEIRNPQWITLEQQEEGTVSIVLLILWKILPIKPFLTAEPKLEIASSNGVVL